MGGRKQTSIRRFVQQVYINGLLAQWEAGVALYNSRVMRTSQRTCYSSTLGTTGSLSYKQQMKLAEPARFEHGEGRETARFEG